MNMALDYAFRLRAPDDDLSLAIDVSDPPGLLLTAHYRGRRSELNDSNLLRLFFSIPLLTLRVVGGIHWEALKLWRKGIGLRAKPPPPAIRRHDRPSPRAAPTATSPAHDKF